MSALHNPPAFPNVEPRDPQFSSTQPGMTLRDWFAGMMPTPDESTIATQQSFDRSRNPHNDTYKPPLRSREQIIAELRYRQADAMLAAREQKA